MNYSTIKVEGNVIVGKGVLVKGNVRVANRFNGGTGDYNELYNKPSINGVELINDKSFEDLGDNNLTNLEIQTIFNQVFGRGE